MHKKKLKPLSNKSGVQEVQYVQLKNVQLKKITSGKLWGKKYKFENSSRLQITGKSAILILQGIKLRNSEILEKLQSEENLFEQFLPILSWKKHHDLSQSNEISNKTGVKVDYKGSKAFDNLEIYKDILYLNMNNYDTHSSLYFTLDVTFTILNEFDLWHS